ncbi:hypothetical protein [Hydrogenophaga sp.]|uniref:hypothetical protein n=1 Tax=Hydrogenophaga sp. TaxID=1904254 RepID=UPI0025BF5012|nr:hypothetical protein [Hydrogenophaga sp.]
MKNLLPRALIGAALIGLCGLAFAQPTAASSPAKKELVARLLKLQQPSVERLAQGMIEQPALELIGRAGQVLPTRVAPDRQEAVAKEIQADAKKFVEEAGPLARARAVKLAPSTVGAVIESQFTEDELKQIVTLLESPAYKKYLDKSEEMEKALLEKLYADTKSTIEPKVMALQQSIGKRLGVSAPPSTTSSAPAPVTK